MEKFKSVSTRSLVTGSSGILYDMDAIKEDVFTLLMMRKGDIPQDNSIGCIVHEYVFSPSLADDEKAEIIEDTISQLSRDPRLSNITVHIHDFEQDLTLAVYADVNTLRDKLVLNVPFKEQTNV